MFETKIKLTNKIKWIVFDVHGLRGLCFTVISFVNCFYLFSCVVSSGGEDGPEAAAGVCGVYRV